MMRLRDVLEKVDILQLIELYKEGDGIMDLFCYKNNIHYRYMNNPVLFIGTRQDEIKGDVLFIEIGKLKVLNNDNN